jgi:hypothetical protein
MLDLERAVRASIEDCKLLREKYNRAADQRVLATAIEYAENALSADDKIKMVLAFEMIDQIKNAKGLVTLSVS